MRPGGRPTRQRSKVTEERMRYAYQVRMNWVRLYGTDPREVLGVVKWDRLLREHFRYGVGPMDAARGIHATELEN